MPTKRKRPSVTRAVRTALRVGNTKYLAGAGRSMYKRRRTSLAAQVNRLTRSIETKETQWKTPLNTAMPHNNLYVVKNSAGSIMNCLQFASQGAADVDMGGTGGQRIGDEITVKSVMFKFFLENALNRSKVYYRFMLLRCSKGDVPTRATLFKNNAGNKMIDQINTERYTIVYQKVLNISPTNPPPISVSLTGTAIGGTDVAGQATRIMSVTIPGRKFGRSGVVKYEDGQSQVKFYDYIPIFLCYDWYGTPEESAPGVPNNVGRINEGYCKVYFKDA